MEYFKGISANSNWGISTQEIEKLEAKIGKKFPKAYFQFLEKFGVKPRLFDSGIRYGNIDTLLDMQLDSETIFKEEGIVLEQDHWVILDLDGGEQSIFFYFGEDDPNVYHFDVEPLAYEGEETPPQIEMVNNCFSNYIKKSIANSKKRFKW